MGQVISFEDRAVATLRARLGLAEEARADLIAFARGHSGAVQAIHEAALAAMNAGSLDALFDCIITDWPTYLGVDRVALALVIGGRGFSVHRHGVEAIEPRLVERALDGTLPVTMRTVDRGHPLFARDSATVRCEALVRIDAAGPLPHGLLLIGQASAQDLDGQQGAHLLRFLGDTIGAMLARWTMVQPD